MTKGELIAAIRRHKGKLWVGSFNASGETKAWFRVSKAKMVEDIESAFRHDDDDTEIGFVLMKDGSLETEDD